MRRQAVVAIAVLGTFLAGCAGMSAAMQYSDVEVQNIDANGHSWRIFDKPAEGRLMITPSVGRAAGIGAVSGSTLGTTDISPTKVDYQLAAQVWLATRHSTSCGITDGYELIRLQWEFKYQCQ
jgi:hypothetical protein